KFIHPDDAKIRYSTALFYWGIHIVKGTKPELAFKEIAGRSYPRMDFLQLVEYLEHHTDIDALKSQKAYPADLRPHKFVVTTSRQRGQESRSPCPHSFLKRGAVRSLSIQSEQLSGQHCTPIFLSFKSENPGRAADQRCALDS